jgi:hypothetical protein
MVKITGTDLVVSPLCLGCAVIGSSFDKKESFDLLDLFTGMGGNFLDTALNYADWAIAGFPGEIFVEFGLEVKKHSPFKVTVAAELTNGSFGYIPVREAFEQGGYEPSLTSYTCAGPESGYRMTETLISLLKNL